MNAVRHAIGLSYAGNTQTEAYDTKIQD